MRNIKYYRLSIVDISNDQYLELAGKYDKIDVKLQMGRKYVSGW